MTIERERERERENGNCERAIKERGIGRSKGRERARESLSGCKRKEEQKERE